MKKKRTTIYLDESTKNLVKTHDVNLSKKVRKLIRREYGAVQSIEQRRDELEEKLDRLLEKKQRIEREMREAEKMKDRLDNLLTKNDVMQQIRQNEEYKARFEEKVRIIRRNIQAGEDDRMIEQYIERNAEVLSSELPFDQEKLEDVLRKGVEASKSIRRHNI